MRAMTKLLFLGLLGGISYAVAFAWLRQRHEAARPFRQALAEATEQATRGAPMTGRGRGMPQRTLDPDGGSVSTRVGRGVVRRD